MKMLICAIYDSATGAYMQPFFCRTKAEAIRSFADAVGKADTPFCSHPEDYTLFLIGDYNDSDAIISSVTAEKLITALECVQGVAVR